jgi:hypothetical protein
VPVFGAAEVHLGLQAVSMPMAPLGRRDERRRIDVRNLADPENKPGRFGGTGVAGCDYVDRFGPAARYIAK